MVINRIDYKRRVVGSGMKICMIVPDTMVKGGIAAVVNGYRNYGWEEGYEISYVESYCDGSKWKKLVKALHGYRDFSRRLHRERFDMVHIHSSFGPSFYRKIPFIYMAAAKKIPIVNHIHGADFDTFYAEASERKKRLVRKVYLKCRKLIALSEEWKECLAGIVPEDRIEVIENYCIIPDLKDNTESAECIRLLFLGEIGQRKGCFDIPEILAGAAEKNSGFLYTMAGDGRKEDIELVKNKLQEYGIADKVIFPGWVRGQEKDDLLKESDIFLFPSYHEGMPMAILEAMAYGKAVISTNVGGIPKLIENGENGYLCEPGNIIKMTEYLLNLMENSEKRKTFGKLAREKVKNSYSMDVHIKKLCALYQAIAGQEQVGIWVKS